jgi:lysophospholipase
VEPEAQEKMASRLPKGERKVVSGAKHEIYRSPDEVLFPWWREILAFLAE